MSEYRYIQTKEQDKHKADQREERRFQAAKDIAAGMWANPSLRFGEKTTAQTAVEEADALLTELDRTKETV